MNTLINDQVSRRFFSGFIAGIYWAYDDKRYIYFAIITTAILSVLCWVSAGVAGKGSGIEMSFIAERIVHGFGFASPYLPEEIAPPTTVSPPLYIWLISGVYEVLGVKTTLSRLVLQFINLFFHCATLTILCKYVEKLISIKSAKIFSVCYAVHPYLVFLPSNVWETSQTTFLLSCVLYLASFRLKNYKPLKLILFGVLLGLTSLSSPAWTISYPLICFFAFNSDLKANLFRSTVLKSLVIFLGFAMTVTPWCWRNYLVAKEFVFVRGVTGPEWYKGNNPEANGGHGVGFVKYYLLPSLQEQEKLREMGEQAYDKYTMKLAKDYIVQNPLVYIRLTLQRMIMWWTGDMDVTYWHFSEGRLKDFSLGLLMIISGAITSLFSLTGLYLLRKRLQELWAIYVAALILPIPYYLIVVGFRYQSALMAFMLIPAAYSLSEKIKKLKI